MPFNDNTIPPSMINSIGQSILNLYPQQDLPGLANNYSSTPARTLAPIQGDLRFDHRFSDNDQIFERVSVSDVHPYNPGYFPQYAGGPIYPGQYSSTGTQAVVGFTHIFSPSFLFEFRAGYSRLNNLGQPPPVSSGFLDNLGIPGIDRYGAQQNSGVSEFSITGVDLVGGSGNIPFIKTTDNYQTSYHFTKNLNKHTIKWGYDLFRRQMNTGAGGNAVRQLQFHRLASRRIPLRPLEQAARWPTCVSGSTLQPASPSGRKSERSDGRMASMFRTITASPTS